MNIRSSVFCLLLSIFCFLPNASAQRFIGGIAVGMNVSQVDGDMIFGYNKVGFNGGPSVKLMLDQRQRFSLTMELLYTQKGAVRKFPPPNGVWVAIGDTVEIDPRYPEYDRSIFYKLRTDYLEIPLVIHFEDPRSRFGIGIGFSWARLVYIREMQWDFGTPDEISGARRLTTAVSSGRYNKNDWGVMADINVPIYKGLKFSFRFQYSLAPFGQARTFVSTPVSENNTETKIRKPYHNTLTFRLVYSFNEKYMENNKYDKEGKRIGPRWVRDPEAMQW